MPKGGIVGIVDIDGKVEAMWIRMLSLGCWTKMLTYVVVCIWWERMFLKGWFMLNARWLELKKVKSYVKWKGYDYQCEGWTLSNWTQNIETQVGKIYVLLIEKCMIQIWFVSCNHC